MVVGPSSGVAPNAGKSTGQGPAQRGWRCSLGGNPSARPNETRLRHPVRAGRSSEDLLLRAKRRCSGWGQLCITRKLESLIVQSPPPGLPEGRRRVDEESSPHGWRECHGNEFFVTTTEAR